MLLFQWTQTDERIKQQQLQLSVHSPLPHSRSLSCNTFLQVSREQRSPLGPSLRASSTPPTSRLTSKVRRSVWIAVSGAEVLSTEVIAVWIVGGMTACRLYQRLLRASSKFMAQRLLEGVPPSRGLHAGRGPRRLSIEGNIGKGQKVVARLRPPQSRFLRG